MANMNLVELQKYKEQLLRERSFLENDLQNRRNEVALEYIERNTSPIKNKHNISVETKDPLQKWTKRKHRGKKVLEMSHRITGISFHNVDKTWLQSDIFLYTADVLMQAIRFSLKLKVKIKDQKHTQTLDIDCTFLDPCESYMLEVTPWVNHFKKIKNFAFFMSMVSDYNQQSVIRAKIMHVLIESSYAFLGDCINEHGGVHLHLHSPRNMEQQLLSVQWSLTFVEKRSSIEHFFVITPGEVGKMEGVDFVSTHSNLINNFCKLGLTRGDLIYSWRCLCEAIENYKGLAGGAA